MKTIIIALLMIIYTATCCCQQSSGSNTLPADEYKAKAKKQRLTAGVLGIPGILLIIGTTYYAADHLFEENDGLTVPFVTGIILTVASVPFIIAADYNAKKAKNLSTSFILQRTPPLVAAIRSIVYYPAVSVRISL